MAGINYTSQSVPASHKALNGGLNSSSGPLGLQDNESSDLQNIDFNKFGSIKKRNGYDTLNSAATSGGHHIDGLHWYEFITAGATVRKALCVTAGWIKKMDDLDGTWDDVTGGLTITSENHCSFANFLNVAYVVNGKDAPFQYDGTSCNNSTMPVGVTIPKFVAEYNNYLFYAHVTQGGSLRASRLHWSALNDTGTWSATDYVDIARDDGQEIAGIKVLADRLVVYKTRSIYNLFYTGDADVPFILPGGGKSNSEVGCVAPHSIQEVLNGHIFLSHDGFYFYDGNNATKISDKVSTTLQSFNQTRYDQVVSMVQKDKNKYWAAFPSSSASTNDRVMVFDYFNNAWTVYVGMAPKAMAAFYVDGDEETPYFGDYNGFVYEADTGTDDNPLGVATAIDAYYWTNWKDYSDLIDKKAAVQAVLFYQITTSSVLSFGYSYDFETGVQFSRSINITTSGDIYGAGVYGTATYAGEGGATSRIDLTGRGRVVRFKFSNATVDEVFQIDGFGILPHLETNV